MGSSQDEDSLGTGTCSPISSLHECHQDELGLRSVSSFSSTTISSFLSEDLGLRKGPVVIDMGTRSCRAGFSGHQTPSAEISTLVSHTTVWSEGLEETRSEAFTGEEALLYPDTEIIEVMQNGIIINWEAAETLWQHMFEHKLGVPPEEHALLITEPPLSPTRGRENVAEVAFESLGSPGIFMAPQPVLSTYAHGRTSALVVDIGHVVTHAVPVHDGNCLAYATKRTDVAGSCLTWYLTMLLGDMEHTLGDWVSPVVEDVKHTCCYVTFDPGNECLLPPTSCTLDFTLPDGQTISLGKERFQCPEVLFNPLPTWGDSYMGIHEMAQRSLDLLPEDIRSVMHRNILLCGGSSLFEGLPRRLGSELAQCLPPGTEVEVVAVPGRRHAAWMGGSVLASLTNFQSCWIRRDEYYEEGPCIVHQKCF
ncbi:actin-like protein 9 [Cygnus olor]|uniref:actin-like protein 9 n=1 Tax=Cygnus olor TaxID=8869 RepID=UPI001ADE4E76|nr:actin-like protein 9 [Cygnus olor]